MSKFFVEGNPSESESESEKELEEIQEEEKKATKKMMFKDVESSESEEEKRTVKTEKEKRFGVMRETIRKLEDKIKINDFVAIYDQYTELNKQLEKAKKIVEKEGLPIFYVRVCFMLENLVNNLKNEEKKKLSNSNNKAYNILKQQIKKNNKNYTAQIEAFKLVLRTFNFFALFWLIGFTCTNLFVPSICLLTENFLNCCPFLYELDLLLTFCFIVEPNRVRLWEEQAERESSSFRRWWWGSSWETREEVPYNNI